MRGLEATTITDIDTTLAEAGAKHGSGLVMLCSFQKEESVLIESIARVAPLTRIVTIDTGVLFPETLATWRAFEQRFGVRIEVQDATGPWTESLCCGEAKVEALERALAGADAWVTGIRREQAPTRAAAEIVEHDSKRDIPKYNPLAFWSDKDLWHAIESKNLPYNELHDRGYDSIGCTPCTQPGQGREGRWAGTDKLECGLHVI